MNRIGPALCTVGKATFRSLDLPANTTEHLLCARHWGQTGEETRGGQAGEGDVPARSLVDVSGHLEVAFLSWVPRLLQPAGLPPPDPHISTLR